MQSIYFCATSWLSRPRLARLAALVGLAAALAGPLASCRSEDPEPDLSQPTTAKPSYAPNENDQMWAIIEQFMAFNAPALLPLRPARPA